MTITRLKLYEEKRTEEPGFHYVLEIYYLTDEGNKEFQRIDMGEAELQQIRLLQGAAESKIFVSGKIKLAGLRSDIDIPEMELTNDELDDLVSMVNLLTGGSFPYRRFVGIEYPRDDGPPIFIAR